jgi:hypothetical protein
MNTIGNTLGTKLPQFPSPEKSSSQRPPPPQQRPFPMVIYDIPNLFPNFPIARFPIGSCLSHIFCPKLKRYLEYLEFMLKKLHYLKKKKNSQ